MSTLLSAGPAQQPPRPRYPRRAHRPGGVLPEALQLRLLGALGLCAIAPATLSGCNLILGPIVAPIFEHGDGYASFGCKVVAPAVILSEEQALEIIRDELDLAGIDLQTGACSSYTASMHCNGGYPETWQILPAERPEQLDGCVSRYGLGVEMVSRSDYHTLVVDAPTHESVYNMDYRSLARLVALNIDASGKGSYVGVFYEPANTNWAWDTGEDAEAEAEAQAELDLRLQVRDFVQWLGDEGGI